MISSGTAPAAAMQDGSKPSKDLGHFNISDMHEYFKAMLPVYYHLMLFPDTSHVNQ